MRTLAGLVALTALAAPFAASAAEDCKFYTYHAEITEVVDGDTVRANIDLGFHIWVRDEKLRLHAINAPELRRYGAGPKVTEAEKAAGAAAKAALADLIEGRDVTLCTIKDGKGKYGRYLAQIYLGDVYVNQWMIDQGHAVAYPDRRAALGNSVSR